jgi:ATP-binding cassette subfamily C (CFTR/MRP) protein 1
MLSAKRIHQYTLLESEDEQIKENDKEMKEQLWPQKGEITLESVTMRYRETLEPALRNVNFKVEAGSFIGIVGRTGAGKSSILHTLFRLTEIEGGKVLLDGINS